MNHHLAQTQVDTSGAIVEQAPADVTDFGTITVTATKLPPTNYWPFVLLAAAVLVAAFIDDRRESRSA